MILKNSKRQITCVKIIAIINSVDPFNYNLIDKTITMSDSKDSTMIGSADSSMDKSASGMERKDVDSLGDMINSAAMSILDGEDFTMGPVLVK